MTRYADLTAGKNNSAHPTSAPDPFRGLGLLQIVIATTPLLLVALAPIGLLTTVMGEDKLVEWVGAVAWLVACLYFFAAWRAGKRHRERSIHSLWLMLLMLITFFAAGEEISWGQRVLGYSTPEILAHHNLQKEANFHNLAILDVRESVDGGHKTGLARWITFARIGTLI